VRNPQFRQLNRVMPKLPVEAMTTYSIQAPAQTHWRVATCAEADCANWRNGWRIHIEKITKLANGEKLVADIKGSGKSWRVLDLGLGQTFWEFEAGQSCFNGDVGQHRVRVGRPELFVVRGGDWRGNPRAERRVHTDIAGWIDDMSTNRDKLMTRLARG
jgi:hypothetical protein